MNFLIRAAAIAAMLHITPVVVLVKRPDAVQALLPGADAYVAREVHLSGTDAHQLHEAVDWSPEDGVLVFYGGTVGSTSVGALEFVRVDTPHGPIEVAVGFTPQGAVRGVVVTKATVEMKPWVLEAVAAGLTDHYRGLKPGGAPGGAGAAAPVPTRSPSRSSPATPPRATSSRRPFKCWCGTASASRTRPSRAPSP